MLPIATQYHHSDASTVHQYPPDQHSRSEVTVECCHLLNCLTMSADVVTPATAAARLAVSPTFLFSSASVELSQPELHTNADRRYQPDLQLELQQLYKTEQKLWSPQ